MTRVLLVVPAYNEEAVIAPTVSELALELDQRGLDWTIVVAENASSDHTADMVRALRHPRILVHAVAMRGKGNAVASAFREFSADVYAFTDADLSVDPSQVVDGIVGIMRGESDIVYGSRLSRQSDLGGREWWRTFSSRSFNLLARAITGTHASDTQCPLKAMTPPAAALLSRSTQLGWFFDLEFLVRAERAGMRLSELPVRWTEHRYPGRKTKLKPLDSLRAIGAMFVIRRTLADEARSSAHQEAPVDAHAILPSMSWLIVGLGNPGSGYAKDRHNVGRMALERILERAGGGAFAKKTRVEAEVAECEIGGARATLVMPETYMNESGRSVAKFIKSPKDAERLIVIHDDIDLPLGTWKFAFDRGEAGHNGLRSISAALKTRAYIRVRVGVLPVGEDGKPKKPKGDGAISQFVLGSFAPEERTALDAVLDEAASGVEVLVREGLDAAMLRFHTR